MRNLSNPECNDDQLAVTNYVVAFLDLLGQKEAMQSVKYVQNNREELLVAARNSVGRIAAMQDWLQMFYESYQLRDSALPQQIVEECPEARKGLLNFQYFSDGVLIYVPLDRSRTDAPLSSISALFSAVATTFMMGLASESPIRVGIDFGWGVELKKNELYGACVAHAYELESQVANWPRVVVSNELVAFIGEHNTNGTSKAEIVQNAMVNHLYNQLAKDVDGNYSLQYLDMHNYASEDSATQEITDKAYNFVLDQLAFSIEKGNVTLAGRYSIVKQYFESNLDNC